MNKRVFKFISLFALVFIALLGLVACQPEVDEVETADSLKPIVNADIHDNRLDLVLGIVRDTNYLPVKDVKIYFGKDNEYATKTESDGTFSFSFIDPGHSRPENQLEYLSVEPDKYNSRAIIKQLHKRPNSENTNEITCFVIVSTDASINLENDVLIRDMPSVTQPRDPIHFDVRIGTNGVRLPKGYPTRSGAVEEVTLTDRGDYSLVDVSVYVNDKLVAKSNNIGFAFDFVVAGARIKLVYEGFTFGASLQDNDKDDRDIEDIEDTLVITAVPGEGAKIFAYTEDLDILIETYGEEYAK